LFYFSAKRSAVISPAASLDPIAAVQGGVAFTSSTSPSQNPSLKKIVID
jgi:hypothetical protein